MSLRMWYELDFESCVGAWTGVQRTATYKIENDPGCSIYQHRHFQVALERLGNQLPQCNFSGKATQIPQLLRTLFCKSLDAFNGFVLESIRSSVPGCGATQTKLKLLADLERSHGVERAAQCLDLEGLRESGAADELLDTIQIFNRELARCKSGLVNSLDLSIQQFPVSLQQELDPWHVLFEHLSNSTVSCSLRHESHQARLSLGTVDPRDTLRLLCSHSSPSEWCPVDFHFETLMPVSGVASGLSHQNRHVPAPDVDISVCQLCRLLEKPPKARSLKVVYDQTWFLPTSLGVVIHPAQRDAQLQPLESWLQGARYRHNHRKALQCILARWLSRLCGTPWLAKAWDLDNIWVDTTLERNEYRKPYVECRKWHLAEELPGGIPDAAFMLRFALLMLRIEFPEALTLRMAASEANLGAKELATYLQRRLEDEIICDKIEVSFRDILKLCQEWDNSVLPKSYLIYEKIFKPLSQELKARFGLDVPIAPAGPQSLQISEPFENLDTIPDTAKSPILAPRSFSISSTRPLHFDDDLDVDVNSPSRKYAQSFLQRFHDFRLMNINSTLIQRRVKIAVLDTGITSNPALRGRLAKIKYDRRRTYPRSKVADVIVERKSFILKDESTEDRCGRGTRVLDLLLRTAPEADYYVAKISNTVDDQDSNAAECIVLALDWAMEKGVDLINMSFAFDKAPRDGRMQEKLREVYGKGIKMFAAAGDHGRNRPRAFPASEHEVICVHASNGRGAWAHDINPSSTKWPSNWNTLGVGIEFSEGSSAAWRSGTVYATSIAVATVANAMDIVRGLCIQKHLDVNEARDLERFSGIVKIMHLMSVDGFVAPWILWEHPEVTPTAVAHILKWKSM